MVRLSTDHQVHCTCRTRRRVENVCCLQETIRQTVVQQGLEAGADPILESQPTSADVVEDGVVIDIVNQRTQETTTLRAKLLIGCDGAHSWVRRRFKMGHPKEMMIGFQTEVIGYEGQDGWLEMYSGSSIASRILCVGDSIRKRHTSNGLWSKADLLDGRKVLDCYNDLIEHPLWKDRFENITETHDTVVQSHPG